MCSARVLAPLKSNAADDHQIAVDNRRNGAAAMGGQQSEVFTERAFPDDFAVADKPRSVPPTPNA